MAEGKDAADRSPDCDSSRNEAEHERRQSPPPPARSPARLLDQRLEVRDTLFEIALIPGGWAGTYGDGHGGGPSESNEAMIASTMRDVKVQRDDPVGLHDQVAAEIRRAIAEGEAKPGERLPPAKDLAAILGVNTNTVLRALRDLRDEGLLEFRRGRGITVTGTPQRGAVVARAKDLVTFARQQGYRVDELVEIIHDVS